MDEWWVARCVVYAGFDVSVHGCFSEVQVAGFAD